MHIGTTPPDLLALRTKLGLSVSRMARELGVGRMTYWRWEQPPGSPHHSTPAHPEMLRRALRDLVRERTGWIPDVPTPTRTDL